MATVTIRYWAAAKDAAGVAEEKVQAGTLAQALDAALASRPPDSRLGPVLSRSSFLVDGVQASRKIAADLVLHDGAVIEVLPAFAGGLNFTADRLGNRRVLRHTGRKQIVSVQLRSEVSEHEQ